MTSISRVSLLAGVLAFAGFGLLARVEAQPAQNTDVLSQLLAEVHGLRVAMEQAASTGPRVQLLTGRLQIEEGRIADLMRRLDAVRSAETTAAREVDELRAQSDRLENVDPAVNMPQEERDSLEKMKPDVKRHLTQAQATLEAERSEEAQLQADLATEQARWTGFSEQLDALDRELSKR